MNHRNLLICGIVGALNFHVAAAEIYKCTKNDGAVVFSDTPCAIDAEIMDIQQNEPAGDWRQNQEPQMALLGTWRTGIHTYAFRAGGRFRDEQHYGGKLIVWRSGTLSLKENRLTLKYLNSGGQLGGGRMDLSESGNVQWAEDNNSFEVTLGGDDYYFNRLQNR